jgi:hypothetical protein
VTFLWDTIPGRKDLAMRWETILSWYDWAARIHFAGTLMSGGLSVVAGIAAFIEGWSGLAIFFAMLGSFAAVAVIYLGFCLFFDRRQANKNSRVPEIELRADAPTTPVSASPPIPDIDAGAAFNQILQDSEWKLEQIRLTPDR